MSQCRKDKASRLLPKYLLIFSVGICLVCMTSHTMAQAPPDDPRLSHDRPQPPAHPKPPSLKAMFSKINIFKKKDSSAGNDSKNAVTQNTTASTTVSTTASSNKKPDQPANTAAEGQPAVKPNSGSTATGTTTPSVGPLAKPVSTTATKKKSTKKKTKPATDSKTSTAPII